MNNKASRNEIHDVPTEELVKELRPSDEFHKALQFLRSGSLREGPSVTRTLEVLFVEMKYRSMVEEELFRRLVKLHSPNNDK